MDDASKKVNLLDNYDVVVARQTAREMARNLGFGLTDQARIATAVSEVARRALKSQGMISFSFAENGPLRGLECACVRCDWHGGAEKGPLPTREILGGVERLMDEFNVQPVPGQESTVIMRKWLQAV